MDGLCTLGLTSGLVDVLGACLGTALWCASAALYSTSCFARHRLLHEPSPALLVLVSLMLLLSTMYTVGEVSRLTLMDDSDRPAAAQFMITFMLAAIWTGQASLTVGFMIYRTMDMWGWIASSRLLLKSWIGFGFYLFTLGSWSVTLLTPAGSWTLAASMGLTWAIVALCPILIATRLKLAGQPILSFETCVESMVVLSVSAILMAASLSHGSCPNLGRLLLHLLPHVMFITIAMTVLRVRRDVAYHAELSMAPAAADGHASATPLLSLFPPFVPSERWRPREQYATPVDQEWDAQASPPPYA